METTALGSGVLSLQVTLVVHVLLHFVTHWK
jgi:hypothetical protein